MFFITFCYIYNIFSLFTQRGNPTRQPNEATQRGNPTRQPSKSKLKVKIFTIF